MDVSVQSAIAYNPVFGVPILGNAKNLYVHIADTGKFRQEKNVVFQEDAGNEQLTLNHLPTLFSTP
jgi:hypothetical protein